MKTAAPEKKSVKTLKGQLFGAVSMMLVAAIALGTSTYAWFINNQAVEVETMNLTVSTSTSMLVAVGKAAGINTSTGAIGADNWTGFKSVITNDDITGLNGATDAADWEKFFDLQMVPASVTTTSLASMQPAFYATNNHVTNGKLDEFVALDFTVAPTTGNSVGQDAVKRLPLKFSASTDMTVYFGNTADPALSDIANLVVADTVAGNVGTVTPEEQAKAIRAALRVAIVPYTDANYSGDVKPIVLQFDKGDKLVPTNENNTDYNSQTTDINEADGKYSAIASVDGSKNVATVGPLTALVPEHASDAINANKTIATKQADGTFGVTTGSIPLFNLTAGNDRQVDVYIWLEGTDQDCLNALSAYHFGLNLPFASVLPEPTPAP